MADHYQSVYETKADSLQHEANVIKQHLGNLKKKTFKSSTSTALDIASFIRDDVESYREKEANITTRGENIVAEARKSIHEVLMTELYYSDKVLSTDAAGDIGLLMPDTASE